MSTIKHNYQSILTRNDKGQSVCHVSCSCGQFAAKTKAMVTASKADSAGQKLHKQHVSKLK